jgi:proteic killer suppression protein
MKIDFKNNKLTKAFTDAGEIKKRYGTMAKKVSLRMDQFYASPILADMQANPSANCHALKGEREGQWAVDISANYRMIFEINQHPVPVNKDGSVNTQKVTDILIIETTDYH